MSTSTGTDILSGHAGDDSITVDGAGNKTLDGGAGTDALIINYGSINSLTDFTIEVKDFSQHGNGSDIYTALTDSASNTIKFRNLRRSRLPVRAMWKLIKAKWDQLW